MVVDTEQILQYFEVSYDQVDEGYFKEETLLVLDMINRRIHAQESLDAVMNFLFEHTTQICPSDRLGLAFIEEDGDRVIAHWARASYSPLLLKSGYTEDINDSSLKQVIANGQVRLIHDLSAYLRAKPNSRSTRLLLEEGVRASMTCPLFVEKRPVALLFLSSQTPRAFTKRHVYQHLAIAQRLSEAVEKVYKLQQLQNLNQSYMEILGFVSHELKSPLASIIMDGKLLTEAFLGELNPRQHEKILKVIHKSEYLLNLVRDYLDLARVESGGIEVNARRGVDFVKEVISQAIDIVQPQIDSKNMILKWSQPPDKVSVEADADLLKIVVVNLLSNAVKYGFVRGTIKIRFGVDSGKLFLSVLNEGYGFPERLKEKLFKKFSRLDTPALKKEKGTGVGLFTCWKIIRAHGGIIQGESRHGQWARFSFEIPQPLHPDNGT